MKRILLLVFGFAMLINLYSHGGEKTGSIGNKIIFGEDDEFVIKEISVTSWDFSEKEILLDKDAGTRLIFKVESGHHGIGISDLDLKSGNMRTGEQVFWDLIDLEVGEYSFFCNVPCGQGHSSMRGKLIVR